MLDQNEYLAFLRLVQAKRHTTRQSLQLALLYAFQLLLAAIILLSVYNTFHLKGVMWAIVSAILVLQPGIKQSLAASAVRIAANLVGGSIALAIGSRFGTGTPQLLAALALTILACELLRLDLGLRTACVAALIVLTSSEGNVISSAPERLTAVLVGCLLAILIQLLLELLRRLLLPTRPQPTPQPQPPSNDSE